MLMKKRRGEERKGEPESTAEVFSAGQPVCGPLPLALAKPFQATNQGGDEPWCQHDPGVLGQAILPGNSPCLTGCLAAGGQVPLVALGDLPRYLGRPLPRWETVTWILLAWPSVNHFSSCPSSSFVAARPRPSRLGHPPVNSVFACFHTSTRHNLCRHLACGLLPVSLHRFHSLCAQSAVTSHTTSLLFQCKMAGGPGGNSRGRGGKFKKPTRGGMFPGRGPAVPVPLCSSQLLTRDSNRR